MKSLAANEKLQFYRELTLPLFANRCKKGHKCLEKFEVIEFDVIHGVCGLFSTTKLTNFYMKPTLAFLFIWFAKSVEGKSYALRKFKKYQTDNKLKGFVSEMKKGTHKYAEQAKKSLDTLSDQCALSSKLSESHTKWTF